MLLSIITAVHLAALSQMESADNDQAVGRNGEVSRYQIMPVLWRKEEVGMMNDEGPKAKAGRFAFAGSPADPALAARVASEIWQNRVDVFRLAYRREPNLRELYLCWHRPARVLNPRARERARAVRFENLVNELTRLREAAASRAAKATEDGQRGARNSSSIRKSANSASLHLSGIQKP